jgi:hypothetical protein
MDSTPEALDVSFTHHGMEARFRARAPREARVLAVAMTIGIVVPMLPLAALMFVGTFYPDRTAEVFGWVMLGIIGALFTQCTAGPLLFAWAGKPAEVHLHVDESTLRWDREGERFAFDLERVTDIEALSGEIRVEDALQTHRMPVAGLKADAVAWLEARMREAWRRRKMQMTETALDREERRKMGRLTERT